MPFDLVRVTQQVALDLKRHTAVFASFHLIVLPAVDRLKNPSPHTLYHLSRCFGFARRRRAKRWPNHASLLHLNV